jgi:hypothetical protein
MIILFCSDTFDCRSVDQHFAAEYEGAISAGFTVGLIDFNAIRRRYEGGAFRQVTAASANMPAIYRGWMLTPDEYVFLDDSLTKRGISLLTTPEQYLHCHWFPNNYPVIESVSPRSFWLPIPECFEISRTLALISQFDGIPLIVKDYVKSRKHEWKEACFIPDSSDKSAVTLVVKRLLELQDDDLQGGLVFREFCELEPVGVHPRSGMPLTLEYRLFVMDGEVVSVSPYWDADHSASVPPIEAFQPVLSRVRSPFFSCDVARQTNGSWIIIELGDGQVSGLPERCNVTEFYRTLAIRAPNQRSHL